LTISKQLEENIGHVIFINKFGVNPEDVDEFLKRWAADAALFKQQPGYISTQLHRGIPGGVRSSTMSSGSPHLTSKEL
jgi:heme-degrading monooxygenase HmoA